MISEDKLLELAIDGLRWSCSVLYKKIIKLGIFSSYLEKTGKGIKVAKIRIPDDKI